MLRFEDNEVLLEVPGIPDRKVLKGLARGSLQGHDRDYQILQYYK